MDPLIASTLVISTLAEELAPEGRERAAVRLRERAGRERETGSPSVATFYDQTADALDRLGQGV
jgi:hypothetical protein